MKTKNKALAVLEIAIVLCSVFLIALPAIAANQNRETQKVSASEVTTASEDDFILEIYGNANEDDCIDMRDYTYAARIICWLEEETDLADANYDGRISVADMTQIGLIILERESELTIVDSSDRIVTVAKPVERIITISCYSNEVLRTLNVEDKIVAVGDYIVSSPVFFGDLSDLPSVGSAEDPDYELILSLEPDLVVMYWSDYYGGSLDQLESLGLTAICVDTGDPMHVCEDFGMRYVEEIKKFGYIFDKENEAEEYLDWYAGYVDKIKSQTEGLSEEDKPWGYTGSLDTPFGFDVYTFTGESGWQWIFKIAGVRNVAAEMTPSELAWVYVNPEWVLEQNPDIIFDDYFPRWHMWGGYEVDDPAEIIATREAILTDTVFVGLDAVESGELYELHTDIAYGPSFIVGLAYIAKLSHPDLFEDLDPEAIHQEYLTEFQRLDFDLDERGIFLYPPIEIDGGLAGIPDKWL